MTGQPGTIIVVHPKERRSKCSVEPLRGDPRFEFRKYPLDNTSDLDDCVRLGMDGPPLSRADAARRLLILDGTWRYADTMERDFSSIPVRSLPRVVTAYPRVSRTYNDPDGGLATIEAVYVAFRLLGRDVTGLLDRYRWAEEFLARNPNLSDSPESRATKEQQTGIHRA